jgi:hypothetical protein
MNKISPPVIVHKRGEIAKEWGKIHKISNFKPSSLNSTNLLSLFEKIDYEFFNNKIQDYLRETNSRLYMVPSNKTYIETICQIETRNCTYTIYINISNIKNITQLQFVVEQEMAKFISLLFCDEDPDTLSLKIIQNMFGHKTSLFNTITTTTDPGLSQTLVKPQSTTTGNPITGNPIKTTTTTTVTTTPTDLPFASPQTIPPSSTEESTTTGSSIKPTTPIIENVNQISDKNSVETPINLPEQSITKTQIPQNEVDDTKNTEVNDTKNTIKSNNLEGGSKKNYKSHKIHKNHKINIRVSRPSKCTELHINNLLSQLNGTATKNPFLFQFSTKKDAIDFGRILSRSQNVKKVSYKHTNRKTNQVDNRLLLKTD